MKKVLYSLFIVLGLFSCTDDLNKNQLIGTSDDRFYKTGEDAISAVNAAYAALQFELSPGGHFRWFWGDIMSDDSEKGGSGDNDVFELLQLETFQGPTNTDLLEGEWSSHYEGIYRANTVLEKVPAIEMDETLKNRILAEAKFLRAYFYYNLVTVFGDVPKIDRLLSPTEYNQPRVDKSEIWAMIETDLLEAIPVLPLRSQYSASEMGRATQGAAQALLAKSYLWLERWSDARTQTQAIINSAEYYLESDYASIFTTAGENGPGSVFEIIYMNASGGNWGKNNANEGTFTNVFTRARGAFEGYGFNIPTQDFVDEFFVEGFEDPRLSATVFRENEPMGDRGIFTKDATGGFQFDYYAKKTFNNKSEEAPFGDPNPNGGTNDRVIRYADVLLMHAEASYHVGDEPAARDAVNEVRARARGANTSILQDITSSGTALLDDIYHERRVELGLEGHRFFDLVRTGRALEELGSLGFDPNIHNVFPVPQSQIQATDGIITQNPGY